MKGGKIETEEAERVFKLIVFDLDSETVKGIVQYREVFGDSRAMLLLREMMKPEHGDAPDAPRA